MAKGRYGLELPSKIERHWQWLAHTSLDHYASTRISLHSSLIALSGSGLKSGTAVKASGGRYFCDRGSTHIRYQDKILKAEYAKWNLSYDGIDPRMIEREELEYATADAVAVPSTFVAKSFIEMGYPADKLFLNPYGARLDRFSPEGKPDSKKFTVLFVGQVSIRKGFLYLLDAFSALKHPNKILKVIGNVSDDMKELISRKQTEDVEFLGQVPNQLLVRYYSTANVMVLPSIEEGLAMVIGEAMACGCAVVATENTGASDFYQHGHEGLIINPFSAGDIKIALQELSDNGNLYEKIIENALLKVRTIGGWDSYGDRWGAMLSDTTPLP
jgi:starch synthase